MSESQSRIPTFTKRTPSKATNTRNNTTDNLNENSISQLQGEGILDPLDTTCTSALGLNASYLMDVVGDNSRDITGGGLDLEASLLSGESLFLNSPKREDAASSAAAATASAEQPQQLHQQQQYKTPSKLETNNNNTTTTNNNNNHPTSTSASIVTANLLSPFSTMLQPHSHQKSNNNNNNEAAVSWLPPESYSSGELSLRPCRKVSVVVQVSYQSGQSAREDDTAATASTMAASSFSSPRTNTTSTSTSGSKAHQQLCLFPLIPSNDQHNTLPTTPQTPRNTNTGSSSDHPSPTSATLNAAQDARDLIVVNPSAFGKFIPSEITMQTARLVAQVANIESEDWARTYRFQQVIWPDQKVKSFTRMAQAMANDLLAFSKAATKHKQKHKASSSTGTSSTSRLLISTGSSQEKTSILFGRPNPSTTTKTKTKTPRNDKEILQEFGLFGATMDLILQELPQYAVCALSVYEIVQEDQISDLLAPPSPSHIHSSRKNRQLQIRQPADRKGAIVEGLTEFPVDSLESMRDCLAPLLLSPQHQGTKARKTYQGGHAVVSLRIWQSAVQHDINLHGRCATLTFVNLARGESPADFVKAEDSLHDFSSPSRTTPSNQRRLTPRGSTPRNYALSSPVAIPSRQSNFLRTSVSSLGGVLRGTMLRQAGSDTVIPYRNSTLTKVLQRSLDHPECRVVVLASLSPLSDAYGETLATLRYVERLLVRTGLPKSPFEKRQQEKRQIKLETSNKSSPDTSLSASPTIMPSPRAQPQILMEQFAGKESILESVITDPRQRLARFYKSKQQLSPTDSSLDGSATPWRPGAESKSAQGTKYMKVDPGTIHPDKRKSKLDTTDDDPDVSSHSEEYNQSTSLAQYIMPPLSPVAKQGEVDDSLESIQRQGLAPLNTALSYDSYVPFRPTPEKARLNPRPKQAMAPELEIAMAQSEDSNPPRQSIGMYQDPTSNRSSATGFFRDIAALQSSVDAMKNANHGIWQASALSIRQIKEFQMSQQALMNKLIAERDNALDTARKSQSEYYDLSHEVDNLLKEKDSEIIALKDVVDSAEADRENVEKIAEEAIAAQDALEKQVSDFEQQVISNRNESAQVEEELNRLSQSKEQVAEELYNVKSELFALRASVDEKQDMVTELENRLENAEIERGQLSRLYADGDESLKQAHENLELVNEQHRLEKEDWKNKQAELKREIRSLSQAQSAQESELSDQLARAEAELQKCKGQLEDVGEKALELEEKESASRHNMEKERAAYRQEIAELRNAVAAAEADRDEWLQGQEDYRKKYMEVDAELGRTRDDLAQRISDVEELSAGLQQTLEDQENLRDELVKKERALEDFQVETRHRLQRVVKYKDDAASILDKTIEENRSLVNTNEQLQEAFNRLSTERDDAVHSRDSARKALSDVQNSIELLQSDRRSDARAQSGLVNERNALKSERDALKSESIRLRDMLKASQRDTQNMSRERTREQDSLLALRRENDEQSSRLRDMLRASQRVTQDVSRERTREQEALSALRRENDELFRAQTRKDNSFQSEREALKTEQDRLQQELNAMKLDRAQRLDERTAPLETIVASTEPRSQGRHHEPDAYRQHRHHSPDRGFTVESLIPPISSGRSARSTAVLPSSETNTRAEEIAACIAFNTRERQHRGDHMPLSTSSFAHRTSGYYSDDEDKELIIAGLKRKVKILERALILEDETNRGDRRRR